ncbi:MAG: CYTH domain-containing protein [Flavobacterium sp.]
MEIERKFLVQPIAFEALAKKKNYIKQGYLNTHPERTVRVRVKNDTGYLTIKGKGNESGTTRMEWEKEIPLEDAQQLLALCEPAIIEKTRFDIEFKGFLWEVDVFHGVHQGLMIAEIELETEDQFFEKPDWILKEVTGIEKYYNAYLTKHTVK